MFCRIEFCNKSKGFKKYIYIVFIVCLIVCSLPQIITTFRPHTQSKKNTSFNSLVPTLIRGLFILHVWTRSLPVQSKKTMKLHISPGISQHLVQKALWLGPGWEAHQSFPLLFHLQWEWQVALYVLPLHRLVKGSSHWLVKPWECLENY